jgi:CHASE2 domain-containing sensor protein
MLKSKRVFGFERPEGRIGNDGRVEGSKVVSGLVNCVTSSPLPQRSSIIDWSSIAAAIFSAALIVLCDRKAIPLALFPLGLGILLFGLASGFLRLVRRRSRTWITVVGALANLLVVGFLVLLLFAEIY